MRDSRHFTLLFVKENLRESYSISIKIVQRRTPPQSVSVSSSIMNFIMSSGVNAAYILDSHGSSGLHLAAEFGHTNIIDRLLRVRSSDNAISAR